MPRTIINLPDGVFDRLREHLLPRGGDCEEAAFLFTHSSDSAEGLALGVIGEILIPPSGFATRSDYYLELADETRAAVIKRAHDLNAGLIECHSHPGQQGACFSWSDLHGFDEFVPHVRWRLGERPYAAVVFAADSIDALAWTRQEQRGVAVNAIHADGLRINPTNLTLAHWSDIYERSPL